MYFIFKDHEYFECGMRHYETAEMNYIKFWTSVALHGLTWCPVPKIGRFDVKERIFLTDTGIQSATTRFRR